MPDTNRIRSNVLRSIAAAVLLGASAPGIADDRCEWEVDDSPSVYASMTQVVVEGKLYDVRGRVARQAFIEVLQECGAGDAVAPFERWRRTRRAVNIESGVLFGAGAVIPYLGWGMIAGGAVAVPISASRAHTQRESMVMVIREVLEDRADK